MHSIYLLFIEQDQAEETWRAWLIPRSQCSWAISAMQPTLAFGKDPKFGTHIKSIVLGRQLLLCKLAFRLTCDAHSKDDCICCIVCLLAVLGSGIHSIGSPSLWVNSNISHQLPSLNLASMLPDHVHQRKEDTLTYGALTPTYIEVVLMRQRCMTILYAASSIHAACDQQLLDSCCMWPAIIRLLRQPCVYSIDSCRWQRESVCTSKHVSQTGASTTKLLSIVI